MTAWQLPLVGLVQGLLLWLLAFGPQAMGARVSMPVLNAVLLSLAATVPPLWYWTAQAELPVRRRWLGVAGIALFVALLPFGLRELFTVIEIDSHDDGFGAVLSVASNHAWPLALWALLSVHLLLGWRLVGRGWDYERLFRLTWRNAVLTGVAAALTLLFFGVLFAGAGLLRLIGIGAPWALLRLPVFNFPIAGAAFGTAFALGLSRAKMLVVMRHFWLSLTAWFLPLVLGFVLVWVAALPFTGLQQLLDTRHAAALLLGITAMCVNFANSVHQDGLATSPLGPRLDRFTRWAWPALLVVVAIAGWALWLRVAHRGWSTDRIWAALVWAVATLYATGYAASAWRHGPAWLPTIARTNVLAACVTVISLALLLSPWLDPASLAVRSQLARLQDGRVTPQDFDYRMLARDTVYGGREALEKLAARAAAGTATPRDEAIAKLAKAQLADPVPAATLNDDSEVASEAQLRARLTLLPATAVPDADLLRQLRGATPDAAWQLSQCRHAVYRCAVWLTDLNGDGRNDAVVISQRQEMNEAPAFIFTARKDGHWELVGRLLAPTGQAPIDPAKAEGGRAPVASDAARAVDATQAVDVTRAAAARPVMASELTLDQWIAAIERRQAKPIAPQWRDLEVNGRRWQTQLEAR